MKNKKYAFTLVELLAVIGIIAILIALLIPALTTVKKMAKETQQKAQFTTIELAIAAFKDDYGDYPPSHGFDPSGAPEDHYCGAQTLTEALLGWDLMGFHPDSAWRDDGKDKNGVNMVYLDGTETPAEKEANLKERKGPYLNTANTNVFRLGELFPNHASDLSAAAPSTFVICDVFGVKSVTAGKKTVKAGNPILYYKADTSSKTLDDSVGYFYADKLIYNFLDDNRFVYSVKEMADQAKYPSHPTPINPLTSHTFFYDYIQDKKVTTMDWPSNPDSYLLISAGPDGLYGTGDDICNFDPNS